MTITLVTGTGTDVGKTIAVAALAAVAAEAGKRVAIVKPIQTGLGPSEPGDLADVTRLTGITEVFEFVRYPDPLSPEAAARRRGLGETTVTALGAQIRELVPNFDLVLVEGAGGLLVRINAAGETFADLARELGSDNIVVVAPGLGTLNHTALTLEVARSRGIPIVGLIVGSWPNPTDLAAQENLQDLANLVGGPLLAVLPADLGRSDRHTFLAAAIGALTKPMGG
ncbi:dethiobiotin synthase [Candidatus Nanopelagicales bacterium]|nr:dethiobiotin synthase [Candidatus Nanopelagicales bacterium]